MSNVAHAPRTDNYSEGKPPRFRFMSSADFDDADYPVRYLVENVMVAGQPMVIGGRAKSLKTSLAIDLAISLGSGTPFAGNFRVVNPCRVGFMSGESGASTIQSTARRVAKSKNIRLRDAQVFWETKLPHLSLQSDRDALAEELSGLKLDVCFIDPAYLCLLNGSQTNPSDVFAMGSLFERISALGQQMDCTIVLLHHFSKRANDRETGMPDLSDLSMSGFSEWARQWMLLKTREPYDSNTGQHRLWMVTGGSAGHGGAYSVDVNEGVMPNRQWEVTIGEHESVGRPGKAEKLNRAKGRVLKFLKTCPEGETSSGIRKGSGVTGYQACSEAIESLLTERAIVATDTIRRGIKCQLFCCLTT